MTAILADLRHAARAWRRHPGFSAAVVLMLALGVGASSAMFAVADAVFLRPLPYPDPQRLVDVSELDPRYGPAAYGVSFPAFQDFARAPSLDSLAAYQFLQLELRGAGEPMRGLGVMASASLFRVLRIEPVLGRAFSPDDDQAGRERVMLLSHGLWRSRFGADPGVAGRQVDLGGVPATVIGVMPAGFAFPGAADFWVPLRTSLPERAAQNWRVHTLACVGRLREGASPLQAQAELQAILERSRHLDEDPGHRARALLLHEARVQELRPVFRVLAGAVLFLLLIACANVAGLLLARLPGRGRELALRAALGAGRGHLVGQALAEAALLALAGGALGLGLAAASLELLRALAPDPRLTTAAIDPRVAGFALLLSLATALLFGAAPAWATRGLDLAGALKSGAPVAFIRTPQALRRLLVVGEAALALVLVAGAGLMAVSLARLAAVDPGFRPERLLTLRVSLPAARYDEPATVVAAFREAQARLESLPGALAASAVSSLPISGGDSVGELSAEGQNVPAGSRRSASFRRTLPGYFETMGIPILQGRDFDARDDGRGPFAVIVNASLARHLAPDGRALGRRIKVGPPEGEPWLTVVGVVADVRNAGLEQEPGFATFEPVAQRPRSTLRFVVRTRAQPLEALAGVRNALLGTFALCALLLAAAGLFGVIAYSVSQRTREIGVRVALGAERRHVLRLVLREGAVLASCGGALGVLGALLLSRLLEGLLFGISARDPATLLAAAALLLVVALLACAVPARRAAAVDPAVTLRHK